MTRTELLSLAAACDAASESCWMNGDDDRSAKCKQAAATLRKLAELRPARWVRISRISDEDTGIFKTADVECRSERLFPLYQLSEVLTDE